LNENRMTREITVNGCKVILNFLSKSNDKTIDVVKKMLIFSQYREVLCKAEKAESASKAG